MTQCTTQQVKTSNSNIILGWEAYFEANYDSIRDGRKEELIDQGYPQFLLDETNDGRDEFVEREKMFYISNQV